MTPKDWHRLIQVREQQKATAAEALFTARRDAERTVAHRDEAQRALASRAMERCASWQGAIGQFSAGALDVERLSRAGSFDALASRRLADAHQHRSRAELQVQQAQARSDQAQAWLRTRSVALEKAERLDQRAKRAQRQREERRAEEDTETAALSAWLRRPGRGET